MPKIKKNGQHVTEEGRKKVGDGRAGMNAFHSDTRATNILTSNQGGGQT